MASVAPPPKSNKTLLIVLIAGGAVLGSCLLCGTVIGLGVVFFGQARDKAKNMECNANLRQLGIASLNIHDTLGVFPSDVNSATGTGIWEDILPFMENNQRVLLCPNRRKFSPSSSGKRDFGYAVTSSTGGKSVFETDGGASLTPIKNANGATNTLLLSHLWMDPKNYGGGDPTDLGYQTKNSGRSINNTAKQDSDPSGSTNHIGGPHANALPSLFADAHVQAIPYNFGQWAEMWNWTNSKPIVLPGTPLDYPAIEASKLKSGGQE
jgi:hypothetical protein